MTKKEELSLEEIEKALVDFYDKKLLEEKNPYKDGFLDDAVDNFCDALKNEKEFSWLSEFGIDHTKSDNANVNYGLPTHVHGDYENGLIYICLKNPGDQVSDDKSFENIRDYYDTYAEKTRNTLENINKSKDKNTPNYDKDRDYRFYEEMNKKILSWKDSCYQDNEKLKEDIKEYVKSNKTKKSILTKELIKIKRIYNGEPKNWDDKNLNFKSLILRNSYYIREYFRLLLIANGKSIAETLDLVNKGSDLYRNCKDKSEDSITNKIINLELCPFRSAGAESVSDLNRTIYAEYSSYIIWNRIGKYLKDKKRTKPKFVFRSYRDWEIVLKNTLSELLKYNEINSTSNTGSIAKKYVNSLLGEYFFTYVNQKGTVSQNNINTYEKGIRRKLSKAEYQEFVDILND